LRIKWNIGISVVFDPIELWNWYYSQKGLERAARLFFKVDRDQGRQFFNQDCVAKNAKKITVAHHCLQEKLSTAM